MAKLFPDIIFKEQVKIRELLGEFKEAFSIMKEDEYYPELVEEITDTVNQELEKASQKSIVALKIPLLNITEIREELSLSDYIIYLIILETNLQGKFFEEENAHLTGLTGIESAQVGNSIRKLIKKDFVYYVDKDNQICYNTKPKTEKQAKKYFDEHPEELDDIFKRRINNKRVLVINPEVLEELYSEPIRLTKEERLEARKKARIKNMEADKKRQNLKNTFIGLTLKLNISVDNIKKSMDEEFKKKHPKIIEAIQKELKERSVTIEDLMQYIDSIKKE